MSATLAARTASASRKRAGPGSSRWAVLAVVLAAQAMDLMDSTIANVAGPSIRRDLGGAGATLQWLSAAYTLAFSVLLITGARLGDRFGRRRVFLVGAAGFTLASAACAAADSPTVLIATRVLQGGFGALLVPQGFGMLRETFAEEEMGQVFAAFGPTLGLATIAAPVLAGVLIGADLFGVTLLAEFVRSTLRRREGGLIEPSLLRNRVYLTGLGVGLMFFGSFAGLLLVVSLFCQLGEGFSPVHAGLTILPMSVGLVIAMLASYGVVERLGRRLIHTGAALVAVGAVVIALTAGGAASVTSWDLAPGLFIVGLGGGCAFGQLFDFILAGVSMREVGSASGVLSASQQLANALGVAVLGTVFFSGLAAGQATHALAVTAWACLVPIVLAFLGTCLLPRRARRTDSA
jgi:predicted MFS family arabinose efflux permease